MPIEKKRVTIALSDAEHDHLTTLADRLACRAITGETAGQPSIRRLIVEMGQGRFVVSSRLAHGNRKGPVEPTPRRRSAAGEPIDAKAGAVAAVVENGAPPIKPLWWEDDEEDSLPRDSYLLSELPEKCVTEAREIGIEERDGEFIAHASWYPEETPVPQESNRDFFKLTPARPDWWPVNGATRGDLVDLLVNHGEVRDAAGVDAWISSHGDWQRDGAVFVRAITWEPSA
jgi:hypothetical protein